MKNNISKNLKRIINEGSVEVSERQSNGNNIVRTKRLWGVNFRVDLEKEFPILRSKRVAITSACREIIWIMIKQSNNMHDLIPHIWDTWADADGSIRKSYGYQIAKPVHHTTGTYLNQLYYVRQLLHKDSTSRYAVLDMWCPGELYDMNCVSYCYTSHFSIIGGRLNCMVTQRSGDYMIGVVFNTSQYAFLSLALARDLGVRPGILLHNISDAHIYEDHYGSFDKDFPTNESFLKLLNNYRHLDTLSTEPVECEFLNTDTNIGALRDHDFKFNNYKVGINCFDKIDFEATK